MLGSLLIASTIFMVGAYCKHKGLIIAVNVPSVSSSAADIPMTVVTATGAKQQTARRTTKPDLLAKLSTHGLQSVTITAGTYKVITAGGDVYVF